MDGKMKWDEQSGFVPAYDSAIMTDGDQFRSMSDEELVESRMICPYIDSEENEKPVHFLH